MRTRWKPLAEEPSTSGTNEAQLNTADVRSRRTEGLCRDEVRLPFGKLPVGLGQCGLA